MSHDGDIDRSNLAQNILSIVAGLVILLMLCISAQVMFSFFDINPIVTFSSSLAILGKAITLNSLLDFQWHLWL